MREPEFRDFESSDGTRIVYRHWPGSGKEAVVLLHRGHEHSGRLQHIVDESRLPQFSMFAWDARGHGRSPGKRGDAPGVGQLVRDLHCFVRHIEQAHGIAAEDVGIVAQSVGAVIAAAWAHDYAPPIRAMVLAAPAFRVKLYVPFARPALKLMHHMAGNFTVKSYVKARYLTHDAERIESFARDPLITRDISVRLLLDLYDTSERLVANAGAIQTPTLVLIAGADRVVRSEPQREFYRRFGSPVKEMHELPGFFHDALGEKDRRAAIDKVREFVLNAFASRRTTVSLIGADRAGFTRDVFQRISTPLSPVSPRGITYQLIRAGLSTGGRLSHGVRLGLESGFDSGAMLDYVYRNEESGVTPLGRFIDRIYLDSPGWRGVRIRRKHVEELLRRAIRDLRRRGMSVRIVDIAAGPGRYLLDAIGGSADRILLRDYCDRNVQEGGALIRARGMQAVASFERGDAFDRQGLASLQPRPTVGVVSGLYELCPENGPVLGSLHGLAEAMEASGWLIYTGQLWHPQLEFIARTLCSHRDHKPWVMRCRSQAELDQLVDSAGFRKVDELADDRGIFTVSLARKAA